MKIELLTGILFMAALSLIYLATFESRTWVKKVFILAYTVWLLIRAMVVDAFMRVKYRKGKARKMDIERYVYPNKERE
jgi:small-conductance mechanosensitive channel